MPPFHWQSALAIGVATVGVLATAGLLAVSEASSGGRSDSSALALSLLGCGWGAVVATGSLQPGGLHPRSSSSLARLHHQRAAAQQSVLA